MQSAASLLGRFRPHPPAAALASSVALLALGAGLGAIAQASHSSKLGGDDDAVDAAPEPPNISKAGTCTDQGCSMQQAVKAKYEKKMKKLRKENINKIHWPAGEKGPMLGLAPRLWMESLDQHHRYASFLEHYWRRWQLSDTPDSFFPWLDHGQGSMIDLPHAPRRLLDEWRVLYLQKDQQPLFHVVIEEGTGRFLWEADGTPVNLPPVRPIESDVPAAAERGDSGEHVERMPCKRTASSPSLGAASVREKAVAALLEKHVERARVRDRLLEGAKAQVAAAIAAGEPPKRSRLAEMAKPLFDEGLLCQLRDPFFADRHDAARTAEGHAYLRHMKELPADLLPNKTWQDFLVAIDHDQGRSMARPLDTGADRLDGKGIFVLDSFGPLYCGVKIRGVFHHSSFVRGHAVRVAGGLRIENGWLKGLTPHSGHYQPSEDMVDEMIDDWKTKGVDFSLVKVSSYVK